MTRSKGIFNSAVDTCQFRSGKCRQAQPYRVVHINVIGFNNDQKNKTVVFAAACWQAKFHVTQEMCRAVGANTDLILWQDENHRLRNRVVIQPVKDSVHPVDRLLRSVVFPAYCPMGLQQIIREAIIGSRTITTELRLNKMSLSSGRRDIAQ